MISTLAFSILTATVSPWQNPQNNGWIPANAELVAHIDLTAAVGSTIGKALLKSSKEIEVDSIAGFTDWTAKLKLRLGRDITAITAYTVPPEESSPVLIISIIGDPEQLFDGLPDDSGYWMRTIDKHAVHSFKSEKQRFYAYSAKQSEGAVPVVFCKELDELFAAIEVFQGTIPSLKGSANPIAKIKGLPGTFLRVVASDVTKLIAKSPSSALLKESTGMTLMAGEVNDGFFCELSVGCKSEDSADNIASMAQGLIALSRLIATNEKTPANIRKARRLLLNAIQVAPDANRVQVSFRCVAAELAKLIQRNK